MIGFSQVFDSVTVSVLLIAVNVAIAVTIISAVSFVASRIRGFSSPVGHAICVCGVVGVVVAPLLVLSLAGWTWGLVEIIVKDRSAPGHRSHGVFADRKYATNDVMSSESSTIAQPKTELSVIDATTPRSPFESAAGKSRPSATFASPQDTGPPTGRDERFTFDGVIYGKILLLTWIVGSLIFLSRRMVAEFRLRRWLAECVPISDLETLQAVQLAANAAGLTEQPMLRRLAVEFRRRRWLARRSRTANFETLEAVQSAGISVGLTEPPILLRSRTLPAPVVCGIMQPTLILPEAVTEGMSRDQFVAVLTHELAHLARRDLATGVWLTIARIAFWWNPLVWLLCSRTENLSEQICDDIATAGLLDPRDYASALLRFAERATNFTQQPASLGLSMSTVSQLEFRVQRILQSNRSRTLRVSATACVIVVLMTTALAAAASMIQIRAASDEMPAEENTAVTQTGLNAGTAVEPTTTLDNPATLVECSKRILVINAQGQPISRATVTTTIEQQEIETLTTGADGIATATKCGTQPLVVRAEATEYRPAYSIVSNEVTGGRLILLPETRGVTVDEQGSSISHVNLVFDESQTLVFNEDGNPELPHGPIYRSRFDQSNEVGDFRLMSQLSIRSSHIRTVPMTDSLRIWAATENGDYLSWIQIQPEDLDKPQTVVLRPTALIEAVCMVNPAKSGVEDLLTIHDGDGIQIATVIPSMTAVGNGFVCRFRFHLSSGSFSLRRHVWTDGPTVTSFEFEVPPEGTFLDLGSVDKLSDSLKVERDWGSVVGRVQVTNTLPSQFRPKTLIAAGRNPNFPGGIVSDEPLVDQVSGGLEGAFVYLAKTPATIHPTRVVPTTPLVFDQVGGRFVPHLMIVRVGQPVECMNTSTIATSVHSYPLKNTPFNMNLRPLTKPGTGLLWTPRNGESVPMGVRSDFHQWMQAYWLVVDHPYATITDKHGQFVIEDLPPGKHVFKVWHERVGYVERKLEITIEPGQVTAQPTISVDAKALSVR